MTGAGLGERIPGYRLDALAGRGGMGVVYRATDLERERTVALKVIAPALASDPVFRERFQREARLLAAVDHPHVISFYDADDAGGRLFLSMRWVDGSSLADVIDAGGGLDAGRVLRIVRQIAGALDAVHTHALVHRDLKPSNVLLEGRMDGDHAYLTDFGAGRALDVPSEATSTGQWLGTIDYVAPEILSGHRADARSDLYALGCVLFEALTGAPPFHRDTQLATLWAHQRDPAPSACERRPALPRHVDAILARALAKDPDARYRTAEQLAQAFGDALQAGRGAQTHSSRLVSRPPARWQHQVLSDPAKPRAPVPRRGARGRTLGASVRRLAALKPEWRRPRVAHKRLIAAPILVAAVGYLLIGQIAAAPSGRTAQAHGPKRAGTATFAQHRPGADANSTTATARKARRRIPRSPSSRRRATRRSRVKHAAGSSGIATPARYTPPPSGSTTAYTPVNTSPSTPQASAASSSGNPAGTGAGPSGSAPFGPGYPGG
jgi:serine/threonine-protein kinase